MCHARSVTTSPGVQDASAASSSLLGASAARDRLAGRARWTRRYFSLFALASLVMVPTIGLGGKAAVLPATLAWGVVVLLMVLWAQRQGVVGRSSWRLHGFAWGAWGLLWAVTVTVGTNLYPYRPVFWLPAALVVSAPLAVAAVLAGRAADPR